MTDPNLYGIKATPGYRIDVGGDSYFITEAEMRKLTNPQIEVSPIDWPESDFRFGLFGHRSIAPNSPSPDEPKS